MDEQKSCALCQHANPPENRFCGGCGGSLTSSGQLVPHREHSPTATVRALPTKLRPAGKALVVGLVALAAEASLLWLSRGTGRADQPSLPAARDTKPAASEHLSGQRLEEVFIWLQEGDFRGRGFARRVVRTFEVAEPTDRHR